MAEKRVLLGVWRDGRKRSAAEQMAVDEALLRSVRQPVVRFYQWSEPAITIGYFADPDSVRTVLKKGDRREIVRRPTGGGVVEHGDDVTFSLAVPKGAECIAQEASGSTKTRYRWIHRCLSDALQSSGLSVSLNRVPATPDESNRCFSNSVPWDVIDPETGRKIAGGAQRRSREGWIHQGSIHLPVEHSRIDAEWTVEFCERLAKEAETCTWTAPAELESTIRERLPSPRRFSEFPTADAS